ncbi:hypothetical protein EGK14_02880 [Erwinia sp. 198]|nr:hypothetical protein EGK14_02880 [Erwinia sp. 198]
MSFIAGNDNTTVMLVFFRAKAPAPDFKSNGVSFFISIPPRKEKEKAPVIQMLYRQGMIFSLKKLKVTCPPCQGYDLNLIYSFAAIYF